MSATLAPWAKLIIQDGVQSGCRNIISTMFQKLSASNNPGDMVFRSKHNVIGVGDSTDDISEHQRYKMAAIFIYTSSAKNHVSRITRS